MRPEAFHPPDLQPLAWSKLPIGPSWLVAREDVSHPLAPGPKARRISAWLGEARQLGKSSIVTAGGMHSNHLHAVACLAQEAGLPVRAWVRGLAHHNLNPLLEDCARRGMELVATTRQAFDSAGLRTLVPHIDLAANELFIPMGAGGEPGLRAMEGLYRQIERNLGKPPDWVALTAGTGATLKGFLRAAPATVRFFVAAPFKDPSFLLDGVDNPDKNPHPPLWGGRENPLWQKAAQRRPPAARHFTSETGISTDDLYMPNLLYNLQQPTNHSLFLAGETACILHCGGFALFTGLMREAQPSLNGTSVAKAAIIVWGQSCPLLLLNQPTGRVR